MSMVRHLREGLERLGAAALLLTMAGSAWCAPPAPACRIAFDMGSSGIRAGSTQSSTETRVDLDVLAVVNAGQGIDTLVPLTTAAFKALRGQGRWNGCHAQVGMGFSAWRLALQQDSDALAEALRQIRQRSGVAVLVTPPAQEGRYGYEAARRALGDRLGTRRVLDIGGGSLQVSGPQGVFGVPLGQKAWHRLLCQTLSRGDVVPCALQPLSTDEVASARRLAAEQLQSLPQMLSTPVDMVATTRPVTRGVAPAVQQLRGSASPDSLASQDLGAVIEAWASRTGPELSAAAGLPPEHAGFLMSDMLLVEGLMTAAASDTLMVAEAEGNNVRGILMDDRAYRWARQHGCYLQRLRTLGEAAYASDPATCPRTRREGRSPSKTPVAP